MRDDFAMFILSHGRPDNQLTLQALEKSGYTGRWYIICDDLDPTVSRYQEKYGDKVIVFNKREWADKTDTFDNFEDMRSVVYARNASFQIAKDLGLKHFGQFDDDLIRFSHRYIDDEGQLKTKDLSQMDSVLEQMIHYMENAPIHCLSFMFELGYMWGKDGKFKDGLGDEIYNSYIFSVDKPVEFRGLMTEDYIMTANQHKLGHVIYAIFDIMFTTPLRGTNDGGLKNLYDANSKYVTGFYAMIDDPGAVGMKHNSKDELVLTTPNRKRMPRILNETWRKSDAR